MVKNQNFRIRIQFVVFACAMMLCVLPYPAKAQSSPNAPASSPHAKILSKLQSITVNVNFNKADIATVIDFLSKKSKELDPDKQGINFVLNIPDDSAKSSDSVPRPKIHREVTVTLDNVPLFDLLGYIAEQTNLQFSVEDYAVSLHPLTAPTPPTH